MLYSQIPLKIIIREIRREPQGTSYVIPGVNRAPVSKKIEVEYRDRILEWHF
jgi:hypothetical protein